MVSQRTRHIGYIRPLKRYPEKRQREALAELCRVVYVEGDGPETLDGAIRSLRAGDVLCLQWLHILAAPKVKTTDRPRQSLWAAVREIERRGASILEVETARSSLKQCDRDDMIRDAIEVLTKAGRALPSRQARAHGIMGGRPPKHFSDEQIEQARVAWFDLRHETNGDAIAASPKGWSMSRSYKTFGPSGR